MVRENSLALRRPAPTRTRATTLITPTWSPVSKVRHGLAQRFIAIISSMRSRAVGVGLYMQLLGCTIRPDGAVMVLKPTKREDWKGDHTMSIQGAYRQYSRLLRVISTPP